jgi:hypothetical protein
VAAGVTLWAAIAATVVGCYVLKLAGTSVPRAFVERPPIARMVLLVPVALLASITALQTVTDGQRLVLDARLAGLAVAAVAVAARAPFLVVVVAASATAALLRAL